MRTRAAQAILSNWPAGQSRSQTLTCKIPNSDPNFDAPLVSFPDSNVRIGSVLVLASFPGPEEVGTDHVSDHALRFSSDVSMELMYRLSFCRNCESLHPGVGLNGKSS